jgi:hypothetical protein
VRPQILLFPVLCPSVRGNQRKRHFYRVGLIPVPFFAFHSVDYIFKSRETAHILIFNKQKLRYTKRKMADSGDFKGKQFAEEEVASKVVEQYDAEQGA